MRLFDFLSTKLSLFADRVRKSDRIRDKTHCETSENRRKLGLSKSATLPAKLCDEGLIGFKRELVLGKI